MAHPFDSRLRSLINPFTAYTAGFLLSMWVYALGYSDLYPPLRPSLVVFILATCVVCIGLLAALPRTQRVVFAPDSLRTQGGIFALIMAVFAVEIVANGGIPLLLIVAGSGASYRDFGIPAVHVAFSGCCYFYAVYWFDLFLVGRLKTYLVFAVSAIATSILTVSREAFIVTLIGFMGVYLQRRGLSKSLLATIALLSAAVLWGFGVVGDVRTPGASGESIILKVGEASDKFLQSGIPTEFFWPYIYTSSPLANLQLNVTDRQRPDAPGLYFALEWLPDFVSKRLLSEDTIDAASPLLVSELLTVCTMYGRAFALMGWMGMCLSFAYFAMVSLLCLWILRRSRYRVAATGILSSLAFLSIFDNLYIGAGGILQVFVALALKLFEHPAAGVDPQLRDCVKA